jgi:hypothetical protein
MAIDPTKSYEADHGFSIDDGTGIWIGGGDSVPTVNAPEGSRYFRTSPAEHYRQDGPGNTNNWVLDKPSGPSAGLSCVAFIRQGSAGNSWLEYEHTTGSETDVMPMVCPFAFTVKSLTFHNRISLSDPTIKIYKNMDLVTPVLTWTMTDVIYGVKNSGLGALTFNQFDKISVHISGGGTNPDDVIICLYGEFSSLNTTDDSGSSF